MSSQKIFQRRQTEKLINITAIAISANNLLFDESPDSLDVSRTEIWRLVS